MGQKLKEFFEKADRLGGLQARIRLAVLTKLTSPQADLEPDSAEHLRRFSEAMVLLEREFAGGPEAALDVQPLAKGETTGDREERLRRHNRMFLDLVSQRALFLGDVPRTISRVIEAAAQTLIVERCSVWFYDDARTMIRCADLFEQGGAKHSAGIELKATDFPLYFKALERERTIAAHDARTDPRTREFAEAYLKPLGITSMLDVPIWADGKMIGVVCHEHIGPGRSWIADEENFAFLMANLIALAVERR